MMAWPTHINESNPYWDDVYVDFDEEKKTEPVQHSWDNEIKDEHIQHMLNNFWWVEKYVQEKHDERKYKIQEMPGTSKME